MYEYGDLFNNEPRFSDLDNGIIKLKSELLRIIDDLDEEDSFFLLELLKTTRRSLDKY